ncbi:MAG TPA: phosphoribosyltransferase family protein [Acidimicrobiia bacterium]|jgi:putative phosphoribosyl transferase
MFADRRDAGRQLAQVVGHLKSPDTIVLGLPRGGVPVAAEVARALEAPMDVIVVRKLGVPGHEELAMGAIGEGGVEVIHREVVDPLGITPDEIVRVERRELVELDRRVKAFRRSGPAPDIEGRQVVIVDDGIATGSTARAACQVARAQGAARVVVAVPVAPQGWERRFSDVADELIALHTPRRFGAIGAFYRDFRQTPDEEVTQLLAATP